MQPTMGAYFFHVRLMRRLASAVLALSLLGSSLPAVAAETETTIVAPTLELPCGGTTGTSRARCITDAIKTWKELEHDYDQDEDDAMDAWKDAHSYMGIGPDYQKALRDYLGQVQKERKAFKKQLLEFRKAFFAEQKTHREKGDGRKATGVKLEKATLEAAKAKCGPEDDDGLYRTCMRQLLRGVPASSMV